MKKLLLLSSVAGLLIFAAGCKKDKVEEIVRELFPLLKNDEVELFLSLNTKDEIKQQAIESGVDDKTLDEAFK